MRPAPCLLVGGHILMEESFAQDPLIRAACAAERQAIDFPAVEGLRAGLRPR